MRSAKLTSVLTSLVLRAAIVGMILLVAFATPPLGAQTPDTNSKRDNPTGSPSASGRVLVHQTKEDVVALLAAKSGDEPLVGIVESDELLGAAEVSNVHLAGYLTQVWVQSQISDWSGTVRATKQEPILSLDQALASFKESYNSRFSDGDIQQFGIKAFAIRGTADEIQYGASLFRTAEIVHISYTGAHEANRKQQLENSGVREIYIPGSRSRRRPDGTSASAFSSTVSSSSPFLPTRSTLSIGPDSDANKRRVEGSIYWATDDSLRGFYEGNIQRTFEIQVVLADNANSRFKDEVYLGTMTNFAADWGDKYFDTNFLDFANIAGTPTEVSYAIGCAYPDLDFVANRTYNFWITTTKGRLETNWAKLQGQLGHQTAACSILRWKDCIVGDRTENISNGFSIVVPSVPKFDSASPPAFYVGEPHTNSTTEKFNSRSLTPVIPFQVAFNRVTNPVTTIGQAANTVHRWSVGLIQDFDGGASGRNAIMLADGSSTARWIHGAIWQFYIPNGPDRVLFDGSKLGYPTTDEQPAATSPLGTTGQVQEFVNGQIYWHRTGPRANSTYLVPAAIYRTYKAAGASSSQLGFPVSNAYQWSSGVRSDFEGGYIYWTASGGAVIVRDQPMSPPTIGPYTWDRTPTAAQPFNGTISGTNFVVGSTRVFFCNTSTGTCNEHPSAGVTVNNSSSLRVSNVNLGSGSWQIYIQTSAGQSARSAPFTVQAAASPPTINGYSWNTTPRPNQPFSGTISGTNFVAGGTQVFFCVNGSSTCFQHPAAGVVVNNSNSLSVSNVNLGSGSWQIYVQTPAGPSARSAPFSVQAASVAPTISGYFWNTTPTANQPFGGTISGTNFISGGTQVFFCVNGSSTCFQHPAAGVTVNNSNSLSVSNVNLGSGSWQIYIQTSAGQSARSAPFTVQAAASPPTINGYSWNTTPRPNQPFSGTISGTNFVAGGTQVFFCVNGSSTCFQHPAAGVVVNNSNSLSVSNVNLGSGSWQIYIQTPAGQSPRSTPFTVQAPPPSPPTISGYFWNTSPTANQPFGGTISGTGFVVGSTQVFFCVNGSSTCFQHPAAGVTVNNSNSLSVINVRLGSGSWQVYVQTSAGQSSRSLAFTVR